METDDLINKLSSQLKPVKNIGGIAQRFAQWLLVAALCVAAGIGFLGLREDWRIVFRDPYLLTQNILILLAVLTSAAAALVLSVPGYGFKRGTKLLVALPILLWLILLTLANFKGAHFHPGNEIHCAQTICVLGLVPGAFLFFLVAQGASLRRAYTGMFSLLAAAGLGSWAVQFTCYNDDFAHILIWHFLPMAALGIVGAFLGKKFLKKL